MTTHPPAAMVWSCAAGGVGIELQPSEANPPGQLGAWRVPLATEGMAVGAACVGSAVKLTVPPLDRPAQRTVVVLWGAPGAWQVLTPRASAEECRVTDLEPLPTGELGLDVEVPGPPGMSRLAVAFPLAALVRWELPEESRWDDVQQAVASGEVPLAYFRLHVVPAPPAD